MKRRSRLFTALLGFTLAVSLAPAASAVPERPEEPAVSAAECRDSGAPVRHAKETKLEGAESNQVVSAARATTGVQAAQRFLRGQGYQSEPMTTVAARADADTTTYLFYGSTVDPQGKAAMVVHQLSGNDMRTGIALVTRDAEGKPIAEVGYAVRGDAVAPLGPREYIGCMIFCLGATCAPDVVRFCARLPFLALVIACIIARCGREVLPCHRTCQRLW